MSHLIIAVMALLDDIEVFLEGNREISATSLGDRALGDRHFVRQLRNGRRVWPETEAKVRAFMAAFGAQAGLICNTCERLASDPATHGCTTMGCGLHQQEAA